MAGGKLVLVAKGKAQGRSMKYYRKRHTKRYAGTRRQKGYIKGPVDSFAQRKFITMDWQRIYPLASVGQTFVGTGYRVNDIALPWNSATIRPYGYDQWKTFYNKYRVHACRVTVSASIRDADATAILFIGSSSRGVAPPTLEASYSDPNYKHWAFTTLRPVNKTKYFTIAGIEGKSKKVIQAAGGFASDFDGSPTNLARVYVGFTNGNSTSGFINIDVRVKIDFMVEFNEPRHLPNSTIPPS